MKVCGRLWETVGRWGKRQEAPRQTRDQPRRLANAILESLPSLVHRQSRTDAYALRSRPGFANNPCQVIRTSAETALSTGRRRNTFAGSSPNLARPMILRFDRQIRHRIVADSRSVAVLQNNLQVQKSSGGRPMLYCKENMARPTSTFKKLGNGVQYDSDPAR